MTGQLLAAMSAPLPALSQPTASSESIIAQLDTQLLPALDHIEQLAVRAFSAQSAAQCQQATEQTIGFAIALPLASCSTHALNHSLTTCSTRVASLFLSC